LSRYFTSKVKENIALNNNHNLLTLSLPDGAPEPLPGQFYMIEVNKGSDPLLKRAFSLFRRTSEGFQVMYRIQGRGTSLLREMKTEDTLEVLGPLGTPYPLPYGDQVPLVVAGGIGIASVFPFLQAYKGKASLFYGARSGDEVFMLDEMRTTGREVYISTDDGSMGTKGNIVDLLDNYLEENSTDIRKFVLYACGPHSMLKSVSKIAALRGMTAYISMEEHMACGLGACLGCVGKTKTGYKRVCKEGPVFNSEEIEWL
jgi:dihydroorotate dehydrogenase electron transfer subunit